jgi:hypothetical protein
LCTEIELALRLRFDRADAFANKQLNQAMTAVWQALVQFNKVD